MSKQTWVKVLAANVRKTAAYQDVAIQEASEGGADLIAILEPAKWPRPAPGYVCLNGSSDLGENRAQLYVRKGWVVIPLPPNKNYVGVKVGGIRVYACYQNPLEKEEPAKRLIRKPGTVVVGDLNARHRDWGDTKNNKRGISLRKAGRECGALVKSPGSPTHRMGGVVDLVVSDLPTQVTKGKEIGSDHVPIWVTFPGRAEQEERVEIPAENVNEYLQAIRLLLRAKGGKEGHIKDRKELEEEARQLDGIFKAARRAWGRVRRHARPGLPWWNEKCAQARTDYRKGTPRREYRAVLLAERRAFYREKLKGVQCPEDLWKITAWRRDRTTQVEPPPLRLPGGRVALDTAEKAETLVTEHLRVPRTGEPWPEPTFDGEEHLVEVDKGLLKKAFLPCKSTAPGEDRVTVDDLRGVWEDLEPLAERLVKGVLRLGHFPEQWKTAEVVFVPKKGKDPSEPRAHRPISLLSVLGKGVERYVAGVLKEEATRRGVFPERQAGAVPKAHATGLVGKAMRWLSENKDHVLACVDVKGAFPSVEPSNLAWVLKLEGFSTWACKVVLSWATGRKARLRFEGKERSLERGIPQGSPLSPVLFAVYMASFVRSRERTLNYVDDVAFCGPPQQVEKDLVDFKGWCSTRGLEVDGSKTEVLSRTDISLRTPWGTVQSQRKVKWLGVTVCARLSNYEHCKKRAAEAEKQINFLRRLNGASYGLPPKEAIHAVKAVVVPTLLYGTELTAPEENKRATELLNVTLRRGIRTAVPAWRTTPVPVLHWASGVLPADVLVRRRRTPKELRGPTDAWVAREGQKYLDQAAHPSATRWPRKNPLKEMTRKQAHAWIAYKSGHGDFRPYHDRFKHPVTNSPCVCGQEVNRTEVETCGLFRWHRKDMDHEAFVKRWEEKHWRRESVLYEAKKHQWRAVFTWGSTRLFETQPEWETKHVARSI